MAAGQRRVALSRPAQADGAREERREPAEALLARVQGGHGNRAAAVLLRRDRGGSEAPGKDAGPSLAAFDAANPGIIKALSYEQVKVWYGVIEGWAANRKVDEALVRHEKHERSTFLDPSSTAPIASSDYLDAHARIEARRTFVDEGKSRFPLAHSAILSPEISVLPAWNVGAEQRFRTWAVQRFAALPLFAELSSRRELVSALEASQNPALQGMPHVNLLWGGGRIRHTKGIVTWNDLMDITEFSERYQAEVANGPEIQELRSGISRLSSHIDMMKIQHQALSDANEEHGVVRHISEALGSPSAMELAVLRHMVKENAPKLPHKEALALENMLAEKEAETGNYPRLKDDEKKGVVGIWHTPDLQLAAARRFFEGGQIELALGAMSACEESTMAATARFAGYERRVMGGAGIAVAWLERAKAAGKMASAFTGAGGVVRAAIGAAGYSFAQEGSQQVVAHWMDPSNKIDLGGLAEQAAIEGLASLIGGVTQGAFVEALTARFGARLVASGMSEVTAKTVLSAAGATTASFYNVPAKIVLDKIIAGKAMPSSLADVANMVTDEAVTSGLMDVAGSYVHAKSAKPEPTATTPGTPEIAAPHAVVEALAGPEGAPHLTPHAAPSEGGLRGQAPTTIMAEARIIAGSLEPLRLEWSTLSPASRAARLIDGVHGTLGRTGVPKPGVVLKKKRGGLFHQDAWLVEIESSLLTKQHLTNEEFAYACEIARHEMEHALQFFRVARREHVRTGEDAATLAQRLQMPIETVREAIAANEGKRPAEVIPEGGAVDVATAAIYENVYDSVKGRQRNEVLKKLDTAFEAIDAASRHLLEAPQDPVLIETALNELMAAEATHRPVIEAYRNFPEEVAAFKAGGEMAAAVKEQARLADALYKARLDERSAYRGATTAWDAARTSLSNPNRRMPTVERTSLNRAVKTWISALDQTRRAERELIRVLGTGTPP